MSVSYTHQGLARPTKQGLYDPRFEHDACGVGLVANIDGRRSHAIIDQGVEVLVNLGHRGAVGADPETGDGAGILLQMPHEFFAKECASLGIPLPPKGEYGVGMVFLPSDGRQRQRCEALIERIVEDEGLRFLGWRKVPVSPDAIGTLANSVRPVIRQFFVGDKGGRDPAYSLELKLLVIRKQITRSVLSGEPSDNDDFYICSFSTNKIVYKGLLIARQLEDFYQDLRDESMMTAFALVHSRFSTNTLGTWKLAHPYRFLIHNGEINTLRGNVNWMTARESVFSSRVLGDDVEKLIPVFTQDQSDTATLDNALALLMASGRSLPHALMMLIPEAWGSHIPMDQAKRDFYKYHSALMEPWDGPALVVATDGTKVCAILDRNGLRPCRYLVTTDGLLVMASETGVLDVPDDTVEYKWRIQPGRIFMLDTEARRIVDDAEIKATLSNGRPYGDWLAKHMVSLSELPAAPISDTPRFGGPARAEDRLRLHRRRRADDPGAHGT